jgi:hypothetical protein
VQDLAHLPITRLDFLLFSIRLVFFEITCFPQTFLHPILASLERSNLQLFHLQGTDALATCLQHCSSTTDFPQSFSLERLFILGTQE